MAVVIINSKYLHQKESEVTSCSNDFIQSLGLTTIDGANQLRFTGNLDMETNKIINLTDPTANQDAATKSYVDSNSGGGTPGGSDTHVQYNNSGSFGGTSDFTRTNDGTSTTIGINGSLTVDNLKFDGNIISSTTGNISLNPISTNGVEIGEDCTASGDYSLASGKNAQATLRCQHARSSGAFEEGATPVASADETITSTSNVNSASTYSGGGSPQNIGRSQNAVFKTTIKIPASNTPEGSIFEMGDSTSGGYVGFDSNYDLIVRCGDGAATPDANDSARIVIPNDSLPNNVNFDLMWEFSPSPIGSARVWIDNILYGEDQTDNDSAFTNDEWSSSADGRYNGNFDGIVAGESGSYSQAVTSSGVTLVSSLSYWSNTTVSDTIKKAQTSYVVSACQTTDATQTEMFIGDVTNARIDIPSGQTYLFDILIVGRSASAGDGAGYRIEGVVENTSGVTSLVGSITKTVIAEDTASWDVTAEADNTNDALAIKVTGQSATTIRWCAKVTLVEIENV